MPQHITACRSFKEEYSENNIGRQMRNASFSSSVAKELCSVLFRDMQRDVVRVHLAGLRYFGSSWHMGDETPRKFVYAVEVVDLGF